MDSIARCGVCNTPTQLDIEMMGKTGRVRVPCRCEQEASRMEEARRRKREEERRIGELRRGCFSDPESRRCTFDGDDRRHRAVSDQCRAYADRWEEMRAGNVGLLFFGDVGTGKSFYACCIANALIDKGVRVLVTNFSRILGDNGPRRDEILDGLPRYELVVMDDLRVERGTDYALEKVYAVTDARYRSGKPMIITTNLSPGDLKNPTSIDYARIYDRILHHCRPIRLTGPSRRAVGPDPFHASCAG